MGAGNAKQVYAMWRDLPHVPFRAFVYMALVALDEDPRYWGGRDGIALAIGVHPDDLADGSPRRRPALKNVDKVTKSLRDAGAIEILSRARPGRNAEYSLNVERSYVMGGHSELSTPGENGVDKRPGSMTSRRNDPPSWGASDPPSRGPMTPHDGDNDPPSRGTRGVVGGGTTRTGRRAKADTASRGPRARDAEHEEPPTTTPPRLRPVNGHRTSQPVVIQPALWPVALRRAQ